MLSRRTIACLVIALASFGYLEYRSWQESRPCREWHQTHRSTQPDTAETQAPDGSVSMEFTSCSFLIEPDLEDRLIGLTGLISTFSFLISLIQDLSRHFRRKRSKSAA